MGWCLVHDHHEMATAMMGQHLGEKVDHLLRGDPFVVQAEKKLPAGGDCRLRRDTPTLSGDSLFRRLTTRGPGLPQQCRERDVGLVLEIQDRPVSADGGANSRHLTLYPLLTLLLRQFEVLSLLLLVRQPP